MHLKHRLTSSLRSILLLIQLIFIFLDSSRPRAQRSLNKQLLLSVPLCIGEGHLPLCIVQPSFKCFTYLICYPQTIEVPKLQLMSAFSAKIFKILLNLSFLFMLSPNLRSTHVSLFVRFAPFLCSLFIVLCGVTVLILVIRHLLLRGFSSFCSRACSILPRNLLFKCFRRYGRLCFLWFSCTLNSNRY